MLITLVSGLAGEIRRLKGRELQALSDPSLARTGGAVDMMLRSCWQQTTEAGPYPPGVAMAPPRNLPNWDSVLLGDRFDALCQIRAATFGDEYDFRVQCRKCSERYDWSVKLSELPRQRLSDASFAQMQSGKNRFECEGPDGRTVVFKLSTGVDERNAQKMRRANGGKWGPIDAVLQNVIEVQGIGVAANAKKLVAYLENAEWPEVTALLKAIDDHGCGVETTFETECSHCRWTQEIELPFEEDFFRPRTKKSSTTEDPESPKPSNPSAAQASSSISIDDGPPKPSDASDSSSHTTRTAAAG